MSKFQNYDLRIYQVLDRNMAQKFLKRNRDKMNNVFGDCPKVGDTVYYVSPTHKKCVKKSEVIEQRHSKRGAFLFSVKPVMKNGDVLNNSETFASKQEAVVYLIEHVISEINYEKISLANTQLRILSLERKLKVLQKHRVPIKGITDVSTFGID